MILRKPMNNVNAGAWGAVGGAFAPVAAASAFPMAAVAGVGAATGTGQYLTGAVISGQPITVVGAAINGGMGAAGGVVGGVAAAPVWYGVSKTALPEIAASQAMQRQLAANLSATNVSRNAAGAATGSIDPRDVKSNTLTCCNKPCAE